MPNWNEILSEIQQKQLEGQRAIDSVRREYLKKLSDYRKRNIITYYSGFLSKPGLGLLDINDEDKEGFMTAVHGLDKDKGLDLFLHTPGGDIAATQSIVDYLHQIFGKDIVAIIPQIAMSAGTMMACSCKEIYMGLHSNLGPIDPHIRQIPAHGVKYDFQRAYDEIKADPLMMNVWRPILEQYRPAFLTQCEMAIKWSEDFVRNQLADNMFSDLTQRSAKAKAKKIVRFLGDYKDNKTHSRHIHMQECFDMGLNVKPLEADSVLQDLVLTVHHCNMHVMQNADAYKMIENHLGVATIKNVARR
ncbi:MAG: ATP-dependent Clp protease proteolytic subunit [Candidatus Thiodiazotropha sp.]